MNMINYVSVATHIIVDIGTYRIW